MIISLIYLKMEVIYIGWLHCKIWDSENKIMEKRVVLFFSEIASELNDNRKLIECKKETLPREKIKRTGMIYFFESLLMLLSTGMGFFECIELMSRTEKSMNLKARLRYFKNNLERGASISQGFQNSFCETEPIISTFFSIHEQTGDFNTAIKDALDYLKDKETLSQKIYQSVVYPLFALLLMIMAVFFFVNYYLVRVSTFSMEFLPNEQIIIFSTIRWIFNGFLLLLIALIVLIIKRRAYIAADLAKIKLFRNFIQKFQSEIFGLYLFHLLKNGVSLIISIDTIRKDPLFFQYKQEFYLVILAITDGLSISKSFEGVSFLNDRHKAIIRHGEQSGKITESLRIVYEEARSERNSALKYFTIFLEPIIILLIGVIIAVTCYFFYRTMFSVSTSFF